MAFGYVIGSGGGAALDAAGSEHIPVYINSDGNPQPCTGIDVPVTSVSEKADKLKIVDSASSMECYIPFINPNSASDNYYSFLCETGASPISYNPATKILTANYLAGTAELADVALKVKNTLTILDDDTSVIYDGSSAKSYSVSTKKCYWNKRSNNTTFFVGGTTLNDSGKSEGYFTTGVSISTSDVLMGAAWNDYAEFRESEGKPGQVVYEDGSGKLILSTKRLQKAASIISDTYGFTVGRNSELDKPIAVAGRVLAFTDRSKFKVGDAVCSGKNGTISKMNRLEIILFPDRIIGYVSEIPTYEEWNNIKINNRIWIRVI